MPTNTITIHVRTRKGFGQHSIASIQKNVTSNSAMAAYNFARRVTMYAKATVHVRTGRLMKSITWKRLETGRFSIRVGEYYGVYHEYGTRYQPPHPFFRPSVAQAKVEFEQDMRKVFSN